MTMKNDAKFEEELTCRFKTDMGSWQILTWALESLKKFYFNVLLLSKVYTFWAKKVQGVIFHDTEKWYKIWKGINLSF